MFQKMLKNVRMNCLLVHNITNYVTVNDCANIVIASMLIAGKRANKLNHPFVLDPVGAGASALRTETAIQLLNEIKFSVVRGNISEIKTLARGNGTTKGVDADAADR